MQTELNVPQLVCDDNKVFCFKGDVLCSLVVLVSKIALFDL